MNLALDGLYLGSAGPLEHMAVGDDMPSPADEEGAASALELSLLVVDQDNDGG